MTMMMMPEISPKPRYMNSSALARPSSSSSRRHKATAWNCKEAAATLSSNRSSPDSSVRCRETTRPKFSPKALAFLDRERRQAACRVGINCSLNAQPHSNGEDMPFSVGRRASSHAPLCARKSKEGSCTSMEPYWSGTGFSAGLSLHEEDDEIFESRRACWHEAGAEVTKELKEKQARSRKDRSFIPRTPADIAAYLMEAGETQEYASLVIERMQADNFVLDFELGGIIMIKSIEEFRKRMHQDIQHVIVANFPTNLDLTDQQKTIVTDTIMKIFPASEWAESEPQEGAYVDALKSAADSDPISFPCHHDILKKVKGFKLLTEFPNWDLTHLQKRAVVDRIVNSLSIAELGAVEPREQLYRDALISAASSDPDTFQNMDATSMLLVGDKFLQKFPAWEISPLQKSAVVARIMKMFPIAALSACEPQMAFYTDALMHEANFGCLQCPVCMEPMVTQADDGSIDASSMWFAPQRTTEHWSSKPCGHGCCRSCMSQWAETGINEYKGSIKCPVLGCSYRLWEQDLKMLVDKKLFKRYHERSNADYLTHLKKMMKKDAKLQSWLKTHARPCPECHVIVSRSEGCNVMTCVCGTRFCYACGFKDCQCKKHKELLPDIWKPRR